MKSSNSIRSAIANHRAIVASLCLIPATCIHAADSSDVEEVVVTGSRIARGSDFENPSPVITVDRASIEKSGYSNLQQLMEKLPANGNGAFSTRGNNQDSSANGTSSISLRGLGADATLVLVNGRRVAISSFAENVTTNFVDINSIPVAAIERVEVLKDGSSAVYGSDAVAGVVNVILRKDFEGLEISGGYGAVTEGSYDEKTMSAVWGMGDDDSNVTLIFDYFKNTTLSNSERGYFGTANQTPRGGQDFRSSRGYPGRFIVNGTTTIDPACPAGSVAGQTCLYDFGPWNLLIPEAERTGLLLLAHQDFGGVELFTEVGVQHNNSIAQGAPTPLDETAGLTVPITHPDNPFPTATTIQIGRYRTVDAGARQWDIESDNLRAVLGLRGSFGDWDWEVAGQRARGKSEQSGDRSMGWVRTDFLQTEINAGRYNPFGGVQNPQDVIDAITTNLVRRGKSDLTMADASITGDLFDLPAGPVKMAAGAEYREESVSDIPDDQFQRGLIFGTEAVSAAAARDSWAMFVEFSVPVLESLELSLAARYDDYSDFGNTTNPKLAVRWAPIDQLAFRASWGTGFRAPSLAQIGLGPSESSQFFIDTYGCADNPVYCASTDYNLVFAGNPNLEAEESETFNVGVAWQPTADINLSLDYWDIKQEKKIDQVPFGFLYTEFCGVQVSEVCERGAPLAGDTLGPLQRIHTTFVNINEQSTSGLDLGASFATDVGPGTMSLGLNYTHLLDFDRVELNAAGTDFVTRSLAGEYEYPEDRAMLWGDFGNDTWGIYASVNYIGSFQDMPDADFDGTLDYDTETTRSVGSFTTVNLQFRYTGIDNLQLLLGLDNAFDERPPFAVGNGDDDLYGYVQSQHNPRGQFWNAKAIYRF
ncbi:outer membrane receptor protein involved in Fe transport [Povalibacter uvarum]|uniref:Outer membrane receptor protein involved in Fe transport n=1 Tax=Povalibacter uvarum TaxID=732238 RepID=A0A841HK76_9GAMM|nr:TonB-dependent receptor [Povalibacter uvarum]MBB6092425.1 outer membrane receptor protein involved in Fe transport [Povalibacter uvarum]